MIVARAQGGQKNRLAYDRLGQPVRRGTCKTGLQAPADPIEVARTEDFDRLVATSALPVVVDSWAP